MPTIFHRGAGDGWTAIGLEQARYHCVIDAGKLRFAPDSELGPPAKGALFLCTERARDGAADPGWAVLCGDDVDLWANGVHVRIGFRLLRHKDEIRLGGGPPLYFSAERPARVEPYAGDDTPRCPRCAQAIRRGDPSVACPGCGVRLHELDELRCWSHLPHCAACDQPTALDGALRWTPEDL
jgi:hypothetical protein